MNSIHIIRPYKFGSVWVFDDKARGLLQEPFVGMANAVIDSLCGDDRNSVTLLFSGTDFPGSSIRVDKLEGDETGTYYTYDGIEFWLCPALFKFFTDGAPDSIFVSVGGCDHA